MSQLDELRRILVGDNATELARLRHRLEDLEARTKDVAEVLAPAIGEGLKQDDSIVDALKQPVSIGLKQAIRADSEEYGEILYPAIAPSIRRAIQEAINSLLITINQAVDSATSVSGFNMRLKSWRTGIPYAQLVLQESFVFKVEHAYLTERESGLLIEDVHTDDVTEKDSDAISAMFSALQSFVQDSFSNNEDDRLTDFKVGEHTILIAHGKKLMLACVVLGAPPESLKHQLYDCLDTIRTKYANQIAQFDGNTEPFSGVDAHLSTLLQIQRKEEVSKPSSKWTTQLLLLALFGLTLWGVGKGFDRYTKLLNIDHFFNATPGVTVTQRYWDSDNLVVEGFFDPASELPMRKLAAYDLDADNLRLKLKPFLSFNRKLEKPRLEKLLKLDGKSEIVANTDRAIPSLRLNGTVSASWLTQNATLLDLLESDQRLQVGNLYLDGDARNQLMSRALTNVEKTRLDRILSTAWYSVSVVDRSWLLSRL